MDALQQYQNHEVNETDSSPLTLSKKTDSTPTIKETDNTITASQNNIKPGFGYVNLLSSSAFNNMKQGTLPDLREMCLDLYTTLFESQNSYSALQFIPVFQKMLALSVQDMGTLFIHKETSHVLVENPYLKVVLIHWPSGSLGNIHGHPNGGGVFKVLHGSVEEMRYTAVVSAQLLSKSIYHKGAIGYIDDQMAYHAVGNPNDSPAITLHAYTPGSK